MYSIASRSLHAFLSSFTEICLEGGIFNRILFLLELLSCNVSFLKLFFFGTDFYKYIFVPDRGL